MAPYYHQEWEGMVQTTPIISGGMNALRLPAFFENLGHSNAILTAGGGAFGHKDGPKQGAVSCRQGEEAWMLWKAGMYGDVSVSGGVIDYTNTHAELKGTQGLRDGGPCFWPELLNRMDGIIAFKPLTKHEAREYHGREDAMLRQDTTEVTEKHAAPNIIGSRPGYVDEESQLMDGTRRKPHSLVLFDEVEKTHPDIASFMLQILVGGRLTDGWSWGSSMSMYDRKLPAARQEGARRGPCLA